MVTYEKIDRQKIIGIYTVHSWIFLTICKQTTFSATYIFESSNPQIKKKMSSVTLVILLLIMTSACAPKHHRSSK